MTSPTTTIPAAPGVRSQTTHNVTTDSATIRRALLQLESPVSILQHHNDNRIANTFAPASGEVLLAAAPALPIEQLGDPDFKSTYNTRLAYYGGAMANGIASVEMLVALGQQRLMGSFGAAGMPLQRVEEAIQRVQAALPDGPYAFNLIHSPFEPAMEHKIIDLYLRYNIRVIEASAFLDVTLPLIYYRLAGLSENPDGSVRIQNRIIAKLSRKEVATRFLSPAPADLVKELLQQGRITPIQARLAERVPVADDVTVEADSGGHTDNRPLVGLLPTMIVLRDELQAKFNYAQPVRIGAGGGISTPAAALAAFMLGAAFVVTGSVNQACVEAGASAHTRKLLAQASMADVTMAPSADMFEMGVKVQVLKLGTMFPMRAARLYEIYSRYASIDEIPTPEREKIEKQIFRRSLAEVWDETVKFFTVRDPAQLTRAQNDPHHQMALIFRWYLGLSSRWSNAGEPGREMDYQIWCGPSMGSFNDWTHGTYLEKLENRRVADVALHIMTGCAYLYRLQALKMQGARFPVEAERYTPAQPAV